MCMGSATMGPTREPYRTFNRRAESISGYELLGVLCEAVHGTTKPFTARKREFLLTHAGVHEGDLRK